MNILNTKYKKNFLVSGIAPANSGVGRLMKVLVPRALALNYTTIYRRDIVSLRRMLSQRAFLSAIVEIVARAVDNLAFSFSLSKITNSNILLLHPQTVGFQKLFKLAERNNIYLYVMDNSFFCLRSYNNNPVTQSECFKCIGNPRNAYIECDAYPVRYSREDSIVILQKLLNIGKRINFLAQNEKQKELLQLHFGSEINCTVVGLNTNEVMQCFHESIEKIQVASYDLVYHGAVHIAKGIDYFVELATHLPDCSCFIPDSRQTVERTIGRQITATNIVFGQCTWESGLKEIVASARLVVNPSLWSAPIEGALLKSLACNANVAVVKTNYGFAHEIAREANILTLPLDPNIASKMVEKFLVDRNEIQRNANVWITAFVSANKTDNVFNAIAAQQH